MRGWLSLSRYIPPLDESRLLSWPKRTRAHPPLLWEKQCNCFRLMWTAAACPLRTRRRGTRTRDPRDHTTYAALFPAFRAAVNPFPIHYTKGTEIHRVYLRDALIYSAGPSLCRLLYRTFIFRRTGPRDAHRGSRGINYFCN